MSSDQGSRPSVADFKRKKATSFPPFPLPLPVEGLGHPPSGCPGVLQRLGTLGAISPTLLILSPKLAMPLDELEALGLIVGQAGLEEYRVHPELSVQ